jgi:diguanylate cyclase (GGDEF)-like protein
LKPTEVNGLVGLPLLQGLSVEEIAHIVSAGRVRMLHDGEIIMHAGDVGDQMFVLLSGAVRVERVLGGSRQTLARFERGEIFGEIAFVSRSARTADVVAVEEARVLELSRAYLERLMAEVPSIAARLLFNLSLILCDRVLTTTRSWMDSEYDKTLTLFQTLASETTIDGIFRRFADAVSRTFPQVQAVRFLLGERTLSWPEDAPDAPLPSAARLAQLVEMTVDTDTATIVCPVHMDQVAKSYVLIQQSAGGSLSGMDLALCSWVCTQLGLVVDRALLHEETRALATHDALTSLYNRNVFSKELAREIARVRRYDTALSLIVVDIDHFKRINDAHGHLVGDVCLRGLATTLLQNLRQVDVVCRYGGEEFAIIMPMTDREGARTVAERLRVAVERLAIEAEGRSIRFTASFGASTLRPGENAESLFRRADEALYRAKRAGRNRAQSAD